MTHWTASVVAILLAGFAGVASAQVNCEAIPHGPARTKAALAAAKRRGVQLGGDRGVMPTEDAQAVCGRPSAACGGEVG
jgi:hypothetical protein